MSTEDTMTMPYARVLEQRGKDVRLDMGEGTPVWFDMGKASLDQDNYEVAAPAWIMTQKLAEALGDSYLSPRLPPSGSGASRFDESPAVSCRRRKKSHGWLLLRSRPNMD